MRQARAPPRRASCHLRHERFPATWPWLRWLASCSRNVSFHRSELAREVALVLVQALGFFLRRHREHGQDFLVHVARGLVEVEAEKLRPRESSARALEATHAPAERVYGRRAPVLHGLELGRERLVTEAGRIKEKLAAHDEKALE